MNIALDYDQIRKDLMFLIKKYAGKYIPGSFYSHSTTPASNILITYQIPTVEEIGKKLVTTDLHGN